MPRNKSYVKYMMRPVSQTNVTQKTNATVTFNPCALFVVAGTATGVAPVAGTAVAGNVSCVRLAASERVGVTPSEVIRVAPPEVERPCRARKPTDVDDDSGSGSWTLAPYRNGTESGC